MTERESPNFGLLLSPIIARVPAHAVPRFLALLERGAAQRYREWAVVVPEHTGVLLACALREDEIADRVDQVWPIDDALLEELERLLPPARDLYYGAFEGMSPWAQLLVQADAELQGAAAWRGIAVHHPDPVVCAELERCSLLEEESSRELQRIIQRRPRTVD